MKAYVKDGTVKSVVLWNTQDLGYLTIYAANAIVNGKLKPGDATFKAGRLGERKIAGDHVLLGDYLVFTRDNIDKYDF
jgi:rhamnose transport system substrate-binding protein